MRPRRHKHCSALCFEQLESRTVMSAGAISSASAATVPGLQVVPSPAVAGTLVATKAISDNDVWAVGYTSSGPLAEHWNGTSWSIVPTPKVSGGAFEGVSASGSNDVWAVGATSTSSSNKPLAEHWNGTTWSVVATPTISNSPYAFLSSVVAIAPNNAWASVYESNSATMLHWDGTSWSTVSSPALSGIGIQAMAADSANDVWAVGSTTVHFNGTTWTQVPVVGAGILHTVTIVSPTDVWAGGTGPYRGIPHAAVFNYNGTSWKGVSFPDPRPNVSTTVTGITAVSANDVWATAFGEAVQWNGTSWTLVSVPSGDSISKITALPDGTVVATGQGPSGTLIMSNSSAMIGSQTTAATSAALATPASGSTAGATGGVIDVGEIAGHHGKPRAAVVNDLALLELLD